MCSRYILAAFVLAWHLPLYAEAAPRIRFESNRGQADPTVQFLLRGNDYTAFLTTTEAVLAFSNHNRHPETAVLLLQLLGSNIHAAAEGLEELPGRSNYFVGSDPARWQANIPAYAKVRYRAVYAGIDLIYYGCDGRLEYDFILAPGASANSIRMGIQGAEGMCIDETGDLVLTVDDLEIRLQRPVAYQVRGANRSEVAVKYVLHGGRVGFDLGPYDKGEPVVIDPVLTYSTYFGGTGSDSANAIAVDAAGAIYVAGTTTSLDFPTAKIVAPNSPAQALCPGNRFFPACTYIFVTKLTPDGAAVEYSSIIGGGFDVARGIAVDATGNAYVTGYATSSNFPLVEPLMNQGQAFIFKLNNAGSALIYSTHFGGNTGQSDTPFGIAVNANGEAYVAGVTGSNDFPTVNPQSSCFSFSGVPFVAKFNATGSALIFSTCLQTPDNSVARAIAVDNGGNAYVTGQLGVDSNLGHNSIDAFVAKLNSNGSMIYSTSLRGSLQDMGFGIAVDASGNAYATGSTVSADFPTLNAFQPNFADSLQQSDAFLTKLNTTGQVEYSTLFGGNGTDLGLAITVDAGGNIYITGSTSSTDLATVNATQPVPGEARDAFIAAFNSNGSTLAFSSYLGGSNTETVHGITLDKTGNVHVAGSTTSADFPTVRPLQDTYKGTGTDPRAGDGDAFVARIEGFRFDSLPVVSSMTPNIASVGSELTAILTGHNLSTATSAAFSGAGVSTTVEPVRDSGTVTLRINVAADASFGGRSLTVVTSSGIVTFPNALVIQSAPPAAATPLPIPEVETGAIQSGYIVVTPNPGSTTPITTLTYGLVRGGQVQSQAAILPTALSMDGAFAVDVVPSIGRNLGLALANPAATAAAMTLTLRAEDGTIAGFPVSLTIPARQQLARFLTELFPSSVVGSAFRGSVGFQSSAPLSVIGLRFSGAEFSTLPVFPINAANVPVRDIGGVTIGGAGALMFAQFAMSGGWATELELVNVTSSTITGRIDVFDSSGNAVQLKLNGVTHSTFTYTIPPKGTFKLAPRDQNGQSPF